MYLEGDIGILVHAKDLWLITEGQALNVLPVCLDSVGLRGIVYPYSAEMHGEMSLMDVRTCRCMYVHDCMYM